MDYDELYKIVIVGDSGVGKTNLLKQFVKDDGSSFDHNTRPTVGVEFGTKTVIHNGVRIKVQIWDTAGQERYRSITNSHYKRAAGALIVYDVSNPKSFESVQNYWANEVIRAAEPGSTLVECRSLVGNKIDLVSEVSEKQHKAALSKIKLKYSGLTSAKTNQNVCQVFEDLIIAIYEHDKKEENGLGKGIKLGAQEGEKGCC
mmetsp:Transcript_7882/g.10366  ORF Transcript_7882/g.10366 Transcript_7882/m.10366 type:complete len:202 (-) Transcript_7882:39-644(-)